MSFACQSCVTRMCLYFIYMYMYGIRMSLVCTRMSSVYHSYVLVCDGMSLVCTGISSVFHSHLLVCYLYVTRMYSHVIRISLVCTRMLFIYHSYLLVCHPYVTRMYLYVIRMSLVCICMSSVCHTYVLVCHPYVTRMWFYHEQWHTENINFGVINYKSFNAKLYRRR